MCVHTHLHVGTFMCLYEDGHTFSVKSQIVNVLDFEGHTVSIAAINLAIETQKHLKTT